MGQVSLFSELSDWKFHLPLVLVWVSPQVTDLSGGATPLSLSPHHSSLAYSWLCIHSASFLINSPNLSSFTTALVVWGVWPRCFPQAIKRLLFKCLHRADVLILPLPAPAPKCWNLSLPQRAHRVAAVCLIRKVRAETRESHTDDSLAGKLLGVCALLLPLFSL